MKEITFSVNGQEVKVWSSGTLHTALHRLGESLEKAGYKLKNDVTTLSIVLKPNSLRELPKKYVCRQHEKEWGTCTKEDK